jgi:hemerythrin
MTVIRWSDDLKVGLHFVDDDHHEAVILMNEMSDASGERRTVLLRQFLTHCEEHFAREEAMMRDTAFFALAPHKAEHERVLDEMRQTLAALEAGEARADYFAEALPQWFLGHRKSMDLVTANFARQRGYGGKG